MSGKTQLQLALGPVFATIEDGPWGNGKDGESAGTFTLDLTQVVLVRQVSGFNLPTYEVILRDQESVDGGLFLGEKGLRNITEAMKRLNPVCNHCGQGHMACDHCGAPLQQP